MFALFLLVSVLATAQPASYPEGFAAHCSGGHEVGMAYAAGYAPPRPVEAAHSASIIDLRYTDNHFVVTQSGYDLIQQIEDGSNGWKVEVLQQVPGDLVLLARSSGMTVLNLYVYHLQYKGKTGALMVSSASYGSLPASSSLAALTCSIQK
jgi:hypothetical protein